MKKAELLSPAGSEAALYAAVQSGADAVYVGGSRFSARASANNFDEEAMQKAVTYCHLRGVKLYVTQNTLIKQAEMQAALHYAQFLYEIGVDGLIVQDLGLANLVHRHLPEFPLHASTQMTVHNLAGVRALERLGFSRVVLARELTEKQMAYIAANCKAELEVFVHGALCFCYSGQCLLSSVLGGRSGNRGRCAQPCRLPYSLHTKNGKKVKSGYLMSPKDLALIDHLDALNRMGIASLKIEGRLKKPAYVATVTDVYRKRLDEGGKATKADVQTLLGAFNRSGFTDAYFKSKYGAEMMSTDNPSNISDESFLPGIEQRCTETANVRSVPVDMHVRCVLGEPMALSVSDADGNSVSVTGEVFQHAQNRPTTAEEIRLRLAKTGGTVFCVRTLDAEVDADGFVAVSALNALRRAALDALMQKRIACLRKEVQRADLKTIRRASRTNTLRFCVSVETAEQAKCVLAYAPETVYAPAGVIPELQQEKNAALLAVKLPELIADERLEAIKASLNTEKILVSGADALKIQDAYQVHCDFRIGVYNAYTAEQLFALGAEQITVSPELNLEEIAALGDAVLDKAAVVAYGRLPLMVMKNCILRAYCGTCQKGKRGFVLQDRKRAEFPVLCRPEACVNVLLNSKPTYMADKLQDLTAAGVRCIRLDFTTESAAETAQVMEAYLAAIRKTRTAEPPAQNTFTRGHFYRGVQ